MPTGTHMRRFILITAATVMSAIRATSEGARWNPHIVVMLLLTFSSQLCLADDYFGEQRRARATPPPTEEESSGTGMDAGAITVWLEDQYVWIADQFWSNVAQVMIGGYVTLAALLFVRRRYRLAHERRWNKVHAS